MSMLSRALILCLALNQLVWGQVGAPQAPDRLAIRRQLEPSFPLPAEPRAPIQPNRPGIVPSAFVGALVGAGAFVGSATMCGKTQLVGPSPYGGRFDGTYLAPGEVLDVPAPTSCTAGFGAGAALVTSWLTQRGRVSGYTRRVASYEREVANYASVRASWERAVALRNRSLDSAVTVAYATAEAATTDARTRAAAERAQAELDAELARAAALAAAPREVPLVAPVTGLVNPDAVAVVIGNQTYARSEVPAVEYAARDAAIMRRFLVQTFGFREENIIFEQNASLSTFTRIFGSLDDAQGQLHGYLNADGTSDVFIFYSGHGAPDPGTGTAYLVPSDADPQTIRLTGYPMRQLTANLAQLKARSITVVLDACFSGLTDRGALLRGISPITLKVENPLLATPNAVIFTASQNTEVSGWYDAQKHGLFTYVFLEALSKQFTNGVPARLPTAQELSAQVSPEVVRLSRRIRQREQTPQLFGAAADQPLPFVRRPQ
jgi:Caspase domain